MQNVKLLGDVDIIRRAMNLFVPPKEECVEFIRKAPFCMELKATPPKTESLDIKG